jgi:hypothetical protein
MTDVGFVVAGYGVILGGLAAYAVLLLRRLAGARRAAHASSPPAVPVADDERG